MITVRSVATMLAGGLVVYVSWRVVLNTFGADAVNAPHFHETQVVPEGSMPAPTPALDVGKLARAFNPTTPSAKRGNSVEIASWEKWNQAAVRSSLHASLVSTVVATPARYSLCQLANTKTNETSVYAVGDKIMGARIYAIDKERVLVDNEGRREYIDADRPHTNSSAATYELVPKGSLPEVEASSPQG